MPCTPNAFLALTNRVVDAQDPNAHAEWLAEVQAADVKFLVTATSLLTSDADHRPAKVKALREAVIVEIERKNTEHLAQTMEKLDASAARLGHYSLLLAGVGVVLAAIQVLQALGVIRL